MAPSIAERSLLVNLPRLFGVAAALLSSSATPLLAHPEFAAATVNRYVKLDLVGADRLRLVYTVMVGAEPALAARQAADRNRDGRLDETETRLLGDSIAKTVTPRLTLDGVPVPLAFEPPAVGLLGDEVAASPFSVDLVATLSLAPARRHDGLFEDDTDADDLGDYEILLVESPHTHLLSGHRGRQGSERLARFVFQGPRSSAHEDRSVGFAFAAATPPRTLLRSPTSTPSPAVGWISAGLLAALLALVLRRRL